MLQIYNSLTRKKERFTPIEPNKIRMYVCGVTVYDYCHIGHARMLVVFDMVVRYLRARGFEVTYVRNITDIDDNIIQRAKQNGEDFRALIARFIDAMHEDEKSLNILPPDIEPRATETIAEIIEITQALLDKGLAYIAANGDVCYDVSGFADYGALSNKKLDDLRAGSRVEIDHNKDDPLDFVLWKSAKPDEPYWPSPWGDGRPGWHIECSAMATRHLGQHFDIHGGGMDLKFPHHENEIAQSEGAHGNKFVNYWMHNGFVQIEDEKMSKSLDNFFTIREVVRQYPSEVIRYFLLSGHYRSPLNYSQDNLRNAKASLTRLYTALRDISIDQDADVEIDAGYRERFENVMDDDFNTPEAFAVLFELARDLNRLREQNPGECQRLAASLRKLGNTLGLLNENPEVFLKAGDATTSDGLSADEIDSLITQRTTARQNKDWSEADRIRAVLDGENIIVEDGAGGSTWRRG